MKIMSLNHSATDRMLLLMSVPAVSFEFFPPVNEAAALQLWEAVQRLAPLQPRFVSVTYGADGSTQSRTHECVLKILRETDLTVAPHLTCVGASRQKVLGIAEDYWRQGVRHLVALRGDVPETARGVNGRKDSSCSSFPYASDLVGGLKTAVDFEISVAAYPEGHPESGSVEADVENLWRKIDAGAHRAITQFFFDTEAFLRYRDRCAARGIDVKIVPGILPILRFSQLLRFAQRCGTVIPDWLHRRFAGLEDDVETHAMIAQRVAIDQVQQLQREGVDEFHFYTLNKAPLTYAACDALGLRA